MRRLLVSGLVSCLGLASCTPTSMRTYDINVPEHPKESFSVVTEQPQKTSLEDPFRIAPEKLVSVDVSSMHTGLPLDWTCDEVEQVTKLVQENWTRVQKELSTPRQAAIYCTRILTHGNHGRSLDYEGIDNERFGKDFWMSGEYTHQLKVVDCDDAAVAAASLLKDDGFPAYILCVQGNTRVLRGSIRGFPFYEEKKFGHAVFLYKTREGKLGTIGINENDIMVPEVCTIDEFLVQWSARTKDEYTSWGIFDIGKVFPDYDTNRRNNDPCER